MDVICENILSNFGLDHTGADILQVLAQAVLFPIYAETLNLADPSLARKRNSRHKFVIDPYFNSVLKRNEIDKLRLQGTAEDDDPETVALKNSIKLSIARQSYENFSQFCFAAKGGDVEVVRDLIRKGVDIDHADYDGRTAFAMVRFEGEAD
jgi:hypothetical protein